MELTYLVCPNKEVCGVGYHRVPPITIKEFLKERPTCRYCGEPLRIVFDRGNFSEEDKALVRQGIVEKIKD